MADDKKGRGNPRKKNPNYERQDRDQPDPKAAKCGASYRHRGIEKRCGKRGFHMKHGPGDG